MTTAVNAILDRSLRAWSTRVSASASLGEPGAAGWSTVAELTLGAARAAADMAAIYDTTSLVGGSFLLARAARAVVEPSLHTLLDVGVLPRLQPEAISLHRNDGGRFDQIAFHHGVEGDEPGSVDAATLAAGVVTVVEGLVEALRGEISLGRRGLWGLVNDAVGGSAVSLHATSPHALTVAAEVMDGIGRSTARPTWSLGDPAASYRRGSCCLAFHLPERGYCDSCPVRARDRQADAPAGATASPPPARRT